jgi:hypothetical protein
MPDERRPDVVRPPEAPMAALRAAVNGVLVPVEQHLDEWDSGLHEALSGPTWTPLLRQHLAVLRQTVRRCRELGDAMVVAAAGGVGAVLPLPGDGPEDLPNDRGELA